jgi:HSP20 family protein
MAFGQLAPRRRSRALGAWSPRREIDRIFDDFFRDFRDLTQGMTAWPSRTLMAGTGPAVDMYEEKEKYVVKAEVPGFEKDDIHISITDSTLQLRGEVKQEEEKEDRNYYYSERSYESFTRDIPLPSAVNQDQIKANFKNGILTIEMPKSKEAVGKEIKIEAK